MKNLDIAKVINLPDTSQAETKEKTGEGPLPKPATGWTGRMFRLASTTTKRVATIVSGAAMLLGIASGFVAFVPRVTVSPSQPLDPNDPFSTPFIVQNDGPLIMRNVRFECFTYEVATTKNSGVKGIGFVPKDFNPVVIRPGEKSSSLETVSSTVFSISTFKSAERAEGT